MSTSVVKPQSILFIFIVAVLCASIGPISSDLYLPSLPFIADDFQVHNNMAQLSLTLYMLGFCIVRLFYGPLSDAVGRKKPLVIALILSFIGAMLCLFAPNIYVLFIGRFIQGTGTAGCAVLALSILRDKLSGTTLARYSAYFGMGNITLIAIAPLVGGYIQHYFGWRVIFTILGLYTIVISILAHFLLETNLEPERGHLKLPNVRRNLKTLLSNQHYLISITSVFLVFGGVLAWLTLGPILLQDVLGLSPIQFGWIGFIVAGCYFIGGFCSSKLVAVHGIPAMLNAGVKLALAGGIALLIPALFHVTNSFVIVLPVMLFVAGAGLIFPNSYAFALTPFPKIAGIASALLGTAQIAGGFFFSGLIALLPNDTQLPLALAFLFCGTVLQIAYKKIKLNSTE
jgi:Bcr/CflA subfamily drug resistance transporter